MLYTFCSGGSSKPTGEEITSHFANMLQKISVLEMNRNSSIGSLAVPLVPSAPLTELAALKVGIVRVTEAQRDLSARLGQASVELGGVRFESLSHTTTWVCNHIPFSGYYLFHDSITLLDAVEANNLSNEVFLDERFHATRSVFENSNVALMAASFLRDLPPSFGKMDASSSKAASSHPLPLVKLYARFSSQDIGAEIKQRIIDEMDSTISSISTGINSCLHSSPVALMLVNALVARARAVIDSLTTWMESFYRELQMGR